MPSRSAVQYSVPVIEYEGRKADDQANFIVIQTYKEQSDRVALFVGGHCVVVLTEELFKGVASAVARTTTGEWMESR